MNTNCRLPLFVTLLITLLLAVEVFAAEPERGRLPDGRAFRRDVQGNQIIDYIAELELSVESLNRRINGLEYELEDKNKTITQFGSGGTKSRELVERNLISSKQPNHSDADQVIQAAVDVHKAVAEKCPMPAPCPKLDCSAKVADASAVGAGKIEKVLAATTKDLNIEREANARASATISKLQEGLKAKETALTTLKVKHTEVLNTLNREQASKIALEKSAKEESKVLALNLAKQDASGRAALKPVKPVADVAGQGATPGSFTTRILPPKKPESTTKSVTRPAGRASLVAARKRAVDSLKGSLTTELNRVRGLVASRNQLFKKYNSKSGKAVQFKPSAPVSSRKQSMKMIQTGIRGATSVNQLAKWQRDIREIRYKITDDMA
ncbi:hypothetical protein OAO01_06015, partial [Oligoflexia bacterium]|nr:hypothetical protein [Oligoflexia bacterium]